MKLHIVDGQRFFLQDGKGGQVEFTDDIKSYSFGARGYSFEVNAEFIFLSGGRLTFPNSKIVTSETPEKVKADLIRETEKFGKELANLKAKVEAIA